MFVWYFMHSKAKILYSRDILGNDYYIPRNVFAYFYQNQVVMIDHTDFFLNFRSI